MEQIGEAQSRCDDIEAIAFVGYRGEQVRLSHESHIDSIWIFHGMLDRDLLYDHSHTYLYLQDTFDLDLPEASAAVIAELETLAEVEAMGTWPADDAVCVIDGVLVIRLGGIS